MDSDTQQVPLDKAREVATLALVRAGAPVQNGALQADLLVDAEARGLPSHGLLRLPRLVDRVVNGVCDPAAAGEINWQGDALAQVNGQHGLGAVVAMTAVEAISVRARKSGVAMASIHSANHLGMLAWYVRRIAAQGQVCIALTTSEAVMHPHGGRLAMVGSNPIAIGVPAQPHPLVFDMATSLVSMGKIHDYANRGLPLEPGWALDEHGEPTLDAEGAKRGAIAPFGGAKGYGLGLAFEVLVTALTGAALGRDVAGTLDSTNRATKGDVFIVAEAGYSHSISNYLDAVRSSPASDGQSRVRVPGDSAERRFADSQATGIAIPQQLWDRLLLLAA